MEIVEMDISKIQVLENVRKDLGDLSELRASIAEKGLQVPLLVTKQHVLIGGHRRLACVKELGHTTVKCIETDAETDEDRFALALVDNIQRKDMAPIEEAAAFSAGIKKFGDGKRALERMAKAIGKKPEYIERRLALLNLVPEAQKALNQGKIQLGHAVILARMETKKQAGRLKEILKEKVGVHEFAESLSDSYGDDEKTFQLSKAAFDTAQEWSEKCAGCKGCPFNGGQQAILLDSGENLKGLCMSPSCFIQKTEDWIHEETKKLKEKGINVVPLSTVKSKDGYSYRLKGEISKYDKDFNDIVKNRLAAEPDVFAVTFEIEDGGVERKVVCINPAKRSKKKAGSAGSESEEVLETSRKERLKNNIQGFRREFIIDKTLELAIAIPEDEGRRHAKKALALFELFNLAVEGSDDELGEMFKQEGCKLSNIGCSSEDCSNLKKFLKLDDPALDRLICRLSVSWLDERDDDLLEIIAKSVGFSMKEHFVVTEEFLNLHTKDQLAELSKELGMHINCTKKTEWVAAILAAETKGKVPKVLTEKPDESPDDEEEEPEEEEAGPDE